MTTMPGAIATAPSIICRSFRHEAWSDTTVISAPNEAVTPAIAASEALNEAFKTAVLLTGSVGQAEAALLQAIGQVRPEHLSQRTFLLACITAAIAPRRELQPSAFEIADASSILPQELARILLLPPDLRRSFVLRFLVGLSGEERKHLKVENIDEGACTAAQELARMAGGLA
jgi:hypothetical protein